MIQGPEVFLLKHIWRHYSFSILAANPTWIGMRKHGNQIENYYIYNKEYDLNNKLKIVEVFSYPRFRDIIELYFKKAKEAVIEGQCVNMTNGIGKIAIRRVERNHKNKSINYAKTKLQPKVWCPIRNKEVYTKIIYFTEDNYCRIGWHKFGKIKNESTYEFLPSKMSRGGTGFGQQLSKALNNDPLLKYRYIYYPLK